MKRDGPARQDGFSLLEVLVAFAILGVTPGAHVVRFQVIGYGTMDRAVTVPITGAAEVNFEVQQQAIALDQVVVTALGIQREQKSLGYAVQTVDQGLEILTGLPAGERDALGCFPADTLNARIEGRLADFAERARAFVGPREQRPRRRDKSR